MGAWPARRVVLAAVVGALMLSAVWLGQIAPLLAQDGVGIDFDDLSSYPTETTVDGFNVQLTNLDADVAYQVVVSSNNPTAVGVGACRRASQTRSVTGVEAQNLRFFVYACAVAPVTLTAEVRAAGASTAAATVSQALTVLAFPVGAPAGVHGVRTMTRGATRAVTPGIVPKVGFDTITHNSARAHWKAPSNGGPRLTGYGILLWKKGTNQPPWGNAVSIGVTEEQHLTGLDPATTYRFRIHACNGTNSCGWWTDPPKEFTTLNAPTPAPQPPNPPDPTEPPPPPPTPPPPVNRPGSKIANQMYPAGQLVSVVLPAASGGHWTYTLTPALSNGLTFDPSSRTIAGTPQVSANAVQHTYTATRTANGATTIETSQFTVAVFDLKIGAQRRDDASYRRLTGPTFWGGVYERWGVLHYAWIWILDVLPGGASRAGDYWFQLRLPASTGFQPSPYGACTWPAAGPSDTTQLKTAWTPAYRNVFLARCGFGSPSTANIELWVRDSVGHEARLDSRTVSGQAWHVQDNVLSYQVAGASGDSITAIASGPDALDGLFPPPTGARSYDGVLLALMNYENAAAVWNGLRAGVSVGRVATTAGAVSDVVIRGYWDPNPGQKGSDGTCDESIACMEVVGPNHPHMDSARTLWIESKPHWGEEREAGSWTLDFARAVSEPQKYQYLPAVLVHELGHAIGLLHSAGASDLMNGAVRTDLSESDQSGARAIYGHHASH